MKVLVTGAQGLVGSRFVELYKNDFELVCPTIEELNFKDKTKVTAYIEKLQPDAIVNFAAITDVRAAQAEVGNLDGNTWKTNFGIPCLLSELANKHKIKLVQISTDLIFSGKDTADASYIENEDLSKQDEKKISFYGLSKLAAEKYIKENCENYCIIRITYPFRSKFTKTDFVRNFIELYDSNKLYPMFNDNAITPTYIDEFCNVLNVVLNRNLSGVLHVCSINSTSHYEVAKYVLEKTGRDSSKLVTIPMKMFLEKITIIPRAIYTAMDTKATQQITGISFKTWQHYVDEMLSQN